MTDATSHDLPTSSDDETVTFNIKSNQAKWTLTLPLSTTAMDLKNKLATSEYANVPAVSQRLIYSGRVLKDDDTLSSHKVKDGNTMHLVKSAPSNQRQNPASQSTTGAAVPPTSTPQVPRNIAAGSGNDPFAALTGARYAGFSQLPSADMFGADGGVSLHV
jgi:ubiquilin